MCGICGAIGIEPREASEIVVRRMMAAMVHRGPDSEGVLLASPAAVGMRRLSIVDLPGGSQPVWNETDTLAVVFNGEIYNFRELRGELEALGHRFRTHSDTEVIVHAYESWGEGCVRRLRGMFAFAVVELPEGRSGRAAAVFLARDRLGIKPLYYAVSGGALLFASEVRALLAANILPVQLSSAAIASYLLFGSVGEPSTIVEGIAALPPGHTMRISAGAPVSSPEPVPYWTAMPEPEGFADATQRPGDKRATAQHVRKLLDDAVGSHLIADVPIGIFLSSGLDSAAIAALASRTRRGIHTFTVAFPEAQFSEAESARRIARHLGTEHLEMTLSDREMTARLDESVAAFDQPSMDGVNTYFVSWAARQAGLKVALSGLGSDELFGGYATFRATAAVGRVTSLARLLPRPVRAAGAGILARGGWTGSPEKWRKVSAACLDPDSFPHPYFFTRLLFSPRVALAAHRGEAVSWRSQPWWRRMEDGARAVRERDNFSGVSWLELRFYLLNTLLRDTDALSMRHSLEVRVPFLDAPLVEGVLALPQSAKLDGSRPKTLLRQALGDLLPEEALAQPKRTFTFPWERWLRGELGGRVAAGLRDWSPALDAHIAGSFAAAVWSDFLRGRTTWSRPWSLYVLNEWVKRNVRAAQPDAAGRAKPMAISAA